MFGINLVWNDEFEDSSLDTTKWIFNIGKGPNWGNNELQYYTDGKEIYIWKMVSYI